VPGAAGNVEDLTDNVEPTGRKLDLTGARIGEVSTAVTKETDAVDYRRAKGEVAALKDNINQMISNLKDTDAEKQRTGLVENKSREIHGVHARPT